MAKPFRVTGLSKKPCPICKGIPPFRPTNHETKLTKLWRFIRELDMVRTAAKVRKAQRFDKR